MGTSLARAMTDLKVAVKEDKHNIHTSQQSISGTHHKHAVERVPCHMTCTDLRQNVCQCAMKVSKCANKGLIYAGVQVAAKVLMR